jgi:pimeloyl-ACP methyl ester carboxylesterase
MTRMIMINLFNIILILMFSVEPKMPMSCNGISQANQVPVAINILVHGVWSDQAVFGEFERKVVGTELAGTWTVKFDWGEDLPFQASEAVGGRAHSVTGMSDQGFVAAAKLKDVVVQLRALVGDEVPINLITHSQGSVIALCCLQEGMVVDNWILMGSPLGKTVISSGHNATSLGSSRQKRPRNRG